MLKIGATVLMVGGPVASSGASNAAQTGSLVIASPLAMTSTPANCPPNPPPDTSMCAVRVGNGVIRGLGQVAQSYTFFIEDCGGSFRVLETTVRVEVAGKGDLQLALERDQECVRSALVASRGFTIIAGSGRYAGASGAGTVEHNAQYTPSGGAIGKDTWNGTLTVPGLDFDVTPPAITGVANRTVRVPKRAKRVRVTYRVTADDDVEGAVTVSCTPKSGARFKVGRTTVKCSAADSSGNTKTSKFTVVVKRRR